MGQDAQGPRAGVLRLRAFARLCVLGPLVLAAALSQASAGLASQPERRWESSSELSYVQAGGNAETSTLGLATTVTRSWEAAEAKVEIGGIRTRGTRSTRGAVGTETAYVVRENSVSEVLAENYRVRARVDRRFSQRTAFFLQSEWIRNTFSGVRNRYLNVLGVSTKWRDLDRLRLRTAYGFTHTVQEDVVANPDVPDRFLGVRLTWELHLGLTDNTEWTSNLSVDGNSRNWSDVRADFSNSVGVAMNEHLALKTSLSTAYDHRPALAKVPLTAPSGDAAGHVLLPRRKLDRMLTLALVVTL